MVVLTNLVRLKQAELSQRLPAPVLAMLKARGAAKAKAAAAAPAGELPG
jgi:hypothetical protein